MLFIFLVFCVVVFGGGSVVLILFGFCVVVFGGGGSVVLKHKRALSRRVGALDHVLALELPQLSK